MYTKEQLALVSTSTLPAEVGEVMRAVAIERMQEVVKLRQYGNVVNPGDEGMTIYQYNILDDLTAADEVAEGAEPDYDDAGASLTSADVKKIMKAFKITWEADAMKKINVKAGQTRAAVEEVFDREDYWIVTRLEADGTSSTTGTDWSTNAADPVKDIQTAKRKAKVLGHVLDTGIIDPVAYENLVSVVASNEWYTVTESVLKGAGGGAAIPFMGINWIQTAHCTNNVVTTFKKGISGAFETIDSKKLSMNIFDDNDSHSTKVQVYERVVPAAMVRPNCVSKLTSID